MNTKSWYYTDGQSKIGPIPEEEIKQMFSTQQLAPDTHVWSQGMTDWVAASTVDALVPKEVLPPDVPPPIGKAHGVARKKNLFFERTANQSIVEYRFASGWVTLGCLMGVLFFTWIPIIGWIGFVAYLIYSWTAYKEVRVLMKEANVLMTGSKYSSKNPMIMKVPRAVYDAAKRGGKI